jgi:amino-acid N-acetyltransferase
MIARVREEHIHAVPKQDVEPVVRAATEADVWEIALIVNEHARQGHLLPRSAESIRDSVTSWVVAEAEGKVVGCGTLAEMNPALVEVRSLAVLPVFRSYGLGGKIVLALVEQARQRGIPTVFALTRAVAFFERLGFSVTNKERFPEKVWRDCAICPLQHACDETAVVIELGVKG